MIKRLLPIQDTFIFGTLSGSIALIGSDGDLRNAGKDEILELGKCSYSDIFESYAARILVKFSTLELSASVAGLTNYTAKLRYFLANSEGLPEEYIVDCYNLAEQWNEGTNRSYDITASPTGATWKYRIPESDILWEIPGADIKPFYDGGYAVQRGYITVYDGGIAEVLPFETRIDGGEADSDYTLETIFQEHGIDRVCTSTFYGESAYRQDLVLDVTDMVPEWLVWNAGAVIAVRGEEQFLSRGASIKYYSADTHTIYKPYLEIGYDDSEYSSSLTPVTSPEFQTVIAGFKQSYRYGDITPVRLQVSPLYPNRIFTTSSIYRANNILPEKAYWGIKDEYTNEMVVDFSEYTKISADDSGSYFNLNTSLLEPERYYRLLVQVEFGENRITVDNKNIFKVVRDGKY